MSLLTIGALGTAAMLGGYVYKREDGSTCRKGIPMANLDDQGMQGNWYPFLLARDLPFAWECCSIVRSQGLPGNNGISFEPSSPQRSMKGELIRNTKEPGVYSFRPEWWWPTRSNMTVLFTDYTSILVMHSCESYMADAITFMDDVWVYTREPMDSRSTSYNSYVQTV